jgi:hypothetical protein
MKGQQWPLPRGARSGPVVVQLHYAGPGEAEMHGQFVLSVDQSQNNPDDMPALGSYEGDGYERRPASTGSTHERQENY